MLGSLENPFRFNWCMAAIRVFTCFFLLINTKNTEWLNLSFSTEWSRGELSETWFWQSRQEHTVKFDGPSSLWQGFLNWNSIVVFLKRNISGMPSKRICVARNSPYRKFGDVSSERSRSPQSSCWENSSRTIFPWETTKRERNIGPSVSFISTKRDGKRNGQRERERETNKDRHRCNSSMVWLAC